MTLQELKDRPDMLRLMTESGTKSLLLMVVNEHLELVKRVAELERQIRSLRETQEFYHPNDEI